MQKIILRICLILLIVVILPNPIRSSQATPQELSGYHALDLISLVNQIGGASVAITAQGDYIYLGVGPGFIIF